MSGPAEAAPPGLLEIGRVTRPHGVRGELKVHLHWSDSEALFEVGQVVVRREGQVDRAYAVVGVRRANRFVLLGLEGVTSMEDAETFRDATLLVARSELPPLEAGECYLADLIGARVEHAGEVVGTVAEVRPYATVDALVIEAEDGRRFEQPLLDHWIASVDAELGLVVLASRDGLIE